MVARARMVGGLLGAAAAALAVLPANTSAGEEYDFCTHAGCDSIVGVKLLEVPNRVASKRVCADEHCKRVRRRERTVRFPCADEPRRVRVKVALRAESGELLIRQHKEVGTRPVHPNGPECPPTCYSVVLDFNARSGEFHRRGP
jgi:hypothetical protein